MPNFGPLLDDLVNHVHRNNPSWLKGYRYGVKDGIFKGIAISFYGLMIIIVGLGLLGSMGVV